MITRTSPPLRKRPLNNSGQTLIEFLLTFALCLGFTVTVARVGFVVSFANYIQYAVFMSARAYQSGAESEADQKTAAENVLKKTVKKGSQDRVRELAEGFGGSGSVKGAVIGRHPTGYDADKIDLSSLQGVRYTFKSSVFPPLDTTVTLRSESWLGREVTNTECLSAVGEGVIDNGC